MLNPQQQAFLRDLLRAGVTLILIAECYTLLWLLS